MNNPPQEPSINFEAVKEMTIADLLKLEEEMRK